MMYPVVWRPSSGTSYCAVNTIADVPWVALCSPLMPEVRGSRPSLLCGAVPASFPIHPLLAVVRCLLAFPGSVGRDCIVHAGSQNRVSALKKFANA
jgi:hypothetical protein